MAADPDVSNDRDVFDDLLAAAEHLGPIVYLSTVSTAGSPLVVPVHADWHEDRLYAALSRSSRTARNIDSDPRLCVHYRVGEDTGWDSLIVWGDGAVLGSIDDKRRLWQGVLGYDLDRFDPGGPDHSPDTCFVEIIPSRILLLEEYGFKGRHEWKAR